MAIVSAFNRLTSIFNKTLTYSAKWPHQMSQLCATFFTKLHATFRLTDINTISLPIERINWNDVSVFCFQIQMNINKNIYSTSLIRWQIVSIVTPCDISNKINQCAPIRLKSTISLPSQLKMGRNGRTRAPRLNSNNS